MITRNDNGTCRFTTEKYSLSFPGDRPFVDLETPNGRLLAELFICDARLESCFEVGAPHLWWLNGHGDQEVYEAEVRIYVATDEPGRPLELSTVSAFPLVFAKSYLSHMKLPTRARYPIPFLSMVGRSTPRAGIGFPWT